MNCCEVGPCSVAASHNNANLKIDQRNLLLRSVKEKYSELYGTTTQRKRPYGSVESGEK